MDNEIGKQLSLIINARKQAYSHTPLLIILMICGGVAEHIMSGMGAPFGIIAFIIFYRRLVSIAHIPCPKCGEPFGTSSSQIVVGPGTDQCQNCGLELSQKRV